MSKTRCDEAKRSITSNAIAQIFLAYLILHAKNTQSLTKGSRWVYSILQMQHEESSDYQFAGKQLNTTPHREEGMVLQLADGSIQMCNVSAERMLGLTVGQMQGWSSVGSPWQTIHEDGSPFPGETHPAMVALQTGQPCLNVVMGVYKPDGELTWLLINSQPLFQINETKPHAVVSTFTDITKQKQGLDKDCLQEGRCDFPEESFNWNEYLKQLAINSAVQLEETNKTLQSTLGLVSSIIEGTSDLIAALDFDFRFIAFNSAYRQEFEDIFGQKVELGMSLVDALAHLPQEQAKNLNIWGRALAGENFTVVEELGDETRKRNYYEITYSSIKDENDKLIGASHIVRDITAKKLAEVALQESEQKFRAIFNSTFQFMGLLQPDGTLIEVNQTALDFGGISHEDVVGRSFWETKWWTISIQTQQRLQNAIASCAAGEFVRYEVDVLGAGDKVVTIDFSLKPIKDETGKVVLLIAEGRDISDRKHLEVALQTSYAQLEGRVERRTSELKRTNAALQESEERLLLALTAAELGMWSLNPVTKEAIWTEKCKALFGLAPDTKINYEVFLNTVHPEDRQQVQDTLARAIKEKVDYKNKYRIIWQDKSVRWIAVKGKVFYDDEGKPIRVMGTAQDITARKQANDRLRQSEQHLRTILDSLLSFVGVMTPDGILIEANRTALATADLKAEDVLGKPFEETYWWSYDPIIQAQLRSAIVRANQGETVRYDVQVRVGENRFMMIDFALVPIFDNTGQVQYLIPSGIDITERKQTEQSLRESEELNRSIFESSADCIKILDLDSCLVSMNSPGLCLMEIDDFTPFIGKSWIEFWQEPYNNAARDAVETAKAGGVGHFRGICPTVKGTLKWWDVLIAAVPDAEGKPKLLVSASRDITAQKQAEEALQKSEQQLRMVLEHLPVGVWISDKNGQILQTNPAGEQIWAGTRHVGIEQYGEYKAWWADTGLQIQAEEWAMARAIQRGEISINEEIDIECFDGSRKTLLNSAVPLRDNQQNITGAIVVNQDISDRKHIEQERDRLLKREQAAREEAEKANRIKDEFLAVLSHELRTPLNPILGWSKLLQTRKFDEARTAEALATIERNAKLQVQLIEDLLDVSRILQGKLSLNVFSVNLASTIKAATDTVNLAAQAKGIQIQTIFAQNVGKITGDPARLQQVLWNLLSNAIKFTPVGGEVVVRLEQVDGYAQITVSDTGKGISCDFLPYVFDYFRQADSATTRKFGGLGLGLAIVRQLVELHGGTIKAESPGEGQGATFTVQLPLLAERQEALEIKGTGQVGANSLNLEGIRILVVDDEVDSRSFVTFVLKQDGADVTAAASGLEALQILAQSKPDILVSDIGMPEMDGYMLMRQVRNLTAEQGGLISAIALTAYAAEFDQQQALAAGFQMHLSKPIEPAELIAAVAKIAGKK